MKKYALIVSAIFAVMLISCATGGKENPDDRAIAAGVKAWNDREPEAAAPYCEKVVLRPVGGQENRGPGTY